MIESVCDPRIALLCAADGVRLAQQGSCKDPLRRPGDRRREINGSSLTGEGSRDHREAPCLACGGRLATAERWSQTFEDHCRKFTTQVSAFGGKADVIADPSACLLIDMKRTFDIRAE